MPDTVVLKITVTDPDPKQAQRINQGVVKQLQGFVAELETPPGQKVPLLKATRRRHPQASRRAGVTATDAQPRARPGPRAAARVRPCRAARGPGHHACKRIEDVPSCGRRRCCRRSPSTPTSRRQPLISYLPSHAPRAEAFRVLRTNLSFIDVDHTSKAFVVTSSVPGEGKSTTAVNVAIAMASAGQRVLLIDGDLRRPQVAEHARPRGDGRADHGPRRLRRPQRGHPGPRPVRAARAHGRAAATRTPPSCCSRRP